MLASALTAKWDLTMSERELFEEAKRSECQVVLANDPDADRLAVAELQPTGEWRVFKGNEIGTLLAAWELRWHKEVRNVSLLCPILFVLLTTLLQYRLLLVECF
jgi:hypothetical protein